MRKNQPLLHRNTADTNLDKYKIAFGTVYYISRPATLFLFYAS